MSTLDEFKSFIARGNVIDMAVGIIIGAAFTSIVNSMVGDIINPIIGVFSGNMDFSNHFLTLSGGDYATLEEAKEAGAATLNYGQFINQVINFLIIAVVIFYMVKVVNRVRAKEEETPAEKKAPPPRQEVLLEEIRDAIKSSKV